MGNVAENNLENRGCDQVGINLDIKEEELSQMEEMENKRILDQGVAMRRM